MVSRLKNKEIQLSEFINALDILKIRGGTEYHNDKPSLFKGFDYDTQEYIDIQIID